MAKETLVKIKRDVERVQARLDNMEFLSNIEDIQKLRIAALEWVNECILPDLAYLIESDE